MADNLLTIHHDLDLVKDLIEVAFMAADALERHHASPMHTVLDIASTRLEEAMKRLEALRQRNRKETADV